MGAGHVPELGGTVLDPASGSAQVGGPTMLPSAKRVDQVCLQPRHWYRTRHVLAVTHPSRHRIPAVTDPSRHRDHSLRARRDASGRRARGPGRERYLRTQSFLFVLHHPFKFF